MKMQMMKWILTNAETEELHAFHWIHRVRQHEIHSFFMPGESLPTKVKIRRVKAVNAGK